MAGGDRLDVAPDGALGDAVGEFVADHLEVLYDLDHELRATCDAIGLAMTPRAFSVMPG